MNSRRIAAVSCLALFAGGLFVVFQPSQAVKGKVFGEAFCAGYPTSYWNSQLSADPGAQSEAISTLTHAGADSVEVLRALLRQQANAEVRLTALELLGKLGPTAQTAGDDLIEASRDGDPHICNLAIITIPKVETPVAKALPALIPLLKTEQAADVARAISVYRGQAKPALPELVALLENDSKDVISRWNAARALGKLGPEGLDALPVLIKYTTCPEDTIREHSVEAIGDIGPTAVAGLPALVDCLDDPYVKVRRDSVRSLGYMGAVARTAVPQIKTLLNDPEEIVRKAAKDALKIIAPEELPQDPPPSIPPASPEAPATTKEAAETPEKSKT